MTKKQINLKTKKRYLISAIVVTKNEEKKLPDCLKSLNWLDEIVVVDTGSEDRTIDIAKKFTTKVFTFTEGGYSDWRNFGLKKARGEWILYVDSDERVELSLRDEIIQLINNPIIQFNAYAIPRRNIILGREMRHGGWYPDYVKRLFKKNKLIRWEGELHEEPVFEGNLGLLKNHLIHLKHDNLEEMVEKTNKWSDIEAKLLFDSHHPKMSWWRFFRIMGTELYYRLIIKKSFLDGVEGVIYAIYQMWSKFITYGKLWEMQIKSDKRSEIR